MGKRLKTTAFALTAAVISACITGFVCADFSARAQQAQAQSDTLIAPTSYEQYLPLSSPTDVAVTNEYTAIAQDNAIYLYDRTGNAYEEIDFSPVTNEQITKTQFYGDYVYCLDAGMLLHRMHLQTSAIETIHLACTNFLIYGNTLFYTTSSGNMSKLYQTDVQAPTASATLLADKIAGLPALAFWNGELYYTIDTQITLLFKINPQTKDFIQVTNFPQTTVHDFYITNNTIAFTVAQTEDGGDFYTYSIADFSEPLSHEQGSFSSVTAHGEYFYTIEENSIKQYSLQTQSFTQFEICGVSDSVHRLNGGAATCLSGETLFIADNGNDRISIYDTQGAQFETPIATTIDPLYISAQDNTLMIANQTTVEIYDIESKTKLYTASDFHGQIVGIASVYGTQYIATNANYYYAITQNESGWSVTDTQKTTTQIPEYFTADLYGKLYILSSNKVFAFHETSLKNASVAGEEVCNFGASANIKQIAIDYNQTVYALCDNKIITQTGENTFGEFSFETSLVYTQDTRATAFALGYLENQTYLLMDGAYILASQRLQLPTVKTVAVEDTDKQIFANASAEFSVLQTQENALLIAFDITKLNGATHFPYTGHHRAKQSITALKMGETQTHYILAHFNESKNAYQTYLVRKDDCSFMANADFRTDYAQENRTQLFVSSEVALYKFPYLTDLLTITTLPRGASVTVLGEIRQLDHEYYHVQYTDEQGNTHSGYIPKAFTNSFSGLPMPEHDYQAGASESDKDAVRRLAVLLLGFSAICILIDYLLLRKRNPEQYETDEQYGQDNE